MPIYKSPRSGRVYSDITRIDGEPYIELLYVHSDDPLKKGDVIRWFETEFPAYLIEVPKHLEERALAGESAVNLGIY